jgi:protein-S-isoprenylcysteine O-methyltransferase Ste14
MTSIFKKQNGMSIVGQGGKIILFMLPSLIAAIWVHTSLPQIAALPESISFIKPVGYVFLLPGLILWGAAVIQLVTGFSKGQLVTTGAYGIVRNPIYSSVTFFVLPAVALMTLTWVYFVASVFLYAGVMVFIGKEERQLTKAFGKEYEDYVARVDRLIPFRRPSRTRPQESKMTRKYLLVCGILAPLYFIVVNDVVAAMHYPGYDRISRPVSELSATYAPSRPILVPLLVIFELLMIAFWIGVWRSAQNNRALRITTGLMIAFAVLGLLAFPFPMKADEVLGANTIHTIIWGMITPLLMLAGMGVSAAAFGKRFRLYAILTLVALVAFSVWSGIEAAQVESGGISRWFGIAERALTGVWLQWVAVLAITLLRVQSDSLGLEDREGVVHPEMATNRV